MAKRSIGVLLLVGLVVACSTTKMTDVWQLQGFTKSAMSQVLVVAVTSNTSNRMLFETGFVEALNEHGINATASFRAIGDGMPEKETVAAYLKNHGEFDHLVVVALSSLDVQTDYVPESVRTYYTGPYYPTWGSYWGTGSTVTMTREAYVDTQTNVILSTSIYNIETKELVWTGRSKTFSVGSISDLAESLANKMIRKI